MRKPKDRDFIRTREGMFFCVTGYLHPPDRYTAYLKYTPNPSGRWRREKTNYRREISYYHASNVERTINYLERHHPEYIHDCPVRNIRFSMVPQESVDTYYKPQERLQEILSAPQDRLEEIARSLAMEISEYARIPLSGLGVSGSILIGLHNPVLSDVNLLVYGQENSLKVRAALRDKKCSEIERVDKALIDRWSLEMAHWFPLTIEESRYNVSRRWNYGFHKGRFFGIHPTRTDEEITERYGDHIYRSQGSAQIRAAITGTEEAIFQPAIYQVENVQVLAGETKAKGIREIISYEGRYRDIADLGQEIEAYGKLESVDGDPSRLIIGTTQLEGAEYIKPFRLLRRYDPRLSPSPIAWG